MLGMLDRRSDASKDIPEAGDWRGAFCEWRGSQNGFSRKRRLGNAEKVV